MTSLQKKGDSWYCQFYWRHLRHSFSVGRVPKRLAEGKAPKVEEIFGLLERGGLRLPEGGDVVEFVEHGGKPLEPEEAPPPEPESAMGSARGEPSASHIGPRPAPSPPVKKN